MKIITTLFAASAMLGGTALYAQDIQEPQADPGTLSVLSGMPAPAATGGSVAARTSLVATTPKLAYWSYSYVSPRDGQTYQGTVVGSNPMNRGARTTTVPVVLVPVRVQFTGTVRTFDPTSSDVGCLGAGNTALSLLQASPMFNPVANYTINGVNVGTATFPDAFQRASFWSGAVSNVSPAYHLAFSVSVAAKQTISVVNGGSGLTASLTGDCSTNAVTSDNPPRLGIVDINVVDAALNTMITTLGITPNQFPFFVLYSVVMSDGPPASNFSNCCILGYHSVTAAVPDPMNPGQTYGIGDYDKGVTFSGTNDISAISHEFLEWVNDPSTANATPAWGGTGQVSGCQSNLETGDPLSGKLMPPVVMGGKTYHPQELAFFSWFLGTPATGAGGKYSSNGTFGGYAKPCPPGGSF